MLGAGAAAALFTALWSEVEIVVAVVVVVAAAAVVVGCAGHLEARVAGGCETARGRHSPELSANSRQVALESRFRAAVVWRQAPVKSREWI